MIFASSSPIGELGSVASTLVADFGIPLVIVCGLLFTTLIIAILTKNVGGDHVDFGLDEDELNPLD